MHCVPSGADPQFERKKLKEEKKMYQKKLNVTVSLMDLFFKKNSESDAD